MVRWFNFNHGEQRCIEVVGGEARVVVDAWVGGARGVGGACATCTRWFRRFNHSVDHTSSTLILRIIILLRAIISPLIFAAQS